jgi:tRNA (Thr-GGU) A37 N-methylase
MVPGRCAKCGNRVDKEDLCLVDGAYICTRCMYGDAEPFHIFPIGVVRNDLHRSREGFRVVGGSAVSRIELVPSQEPFMYKLEDERYLTIVYYLHQARAVRSVFSRGLDGKKVGVFASRTPDRLSGIAIQEVELLDVEGTTLRVRGLDAVDGSPVLDIKLGLRALG